MWAEQTIEMPVITADDDIPKYSCSSKKIMLVISGESFVQQMIYMSSLMRGGGGGGGECFEWKFNPGPAETRYAMPLQTL